MYKPDEERNQTKVGLKLEGLLKLAGVATRKKSDQGGIETTEYLAWMMSEVAKEIRPRWD
ncbi:MAG: hypothetical protein OD814_001740 [Candidatus Alkanophagales archaeon MCA70_species_1]|nr:hypothetical protein [Candidatus Alkanophaga volatiphilum]